MDLIATAAPALGEAFGLIFTPSAMLYLTAGVLLGLAVGVFPGLGGIAGLSLVLPFIYGMGPVEGLSLMVGLVAVIPTSDTFASVLLGIPGSSASQATVLDGFPLSKRGEAARALAAAFASSLFGGLFGATLLTAFILIARPLVLAFGVPELLLLTLLGFAMVGVLAGASILKGLVAVSLGMIVGAIGEAPAQGSPRLAFDTWYLSDGFSLVVVGLGIFAIPEILSLMRRDRAISDTGALGSGWARGVADWWRNKWLSFRCAAIGVVVGVIPGLGGSVVDWIAYGHSVQTTKDRANFGKGEIRGVIGPESSNNAKEGGGLVPTLLFGIPGSGSMAVFIGGMILLGYEAGPQMIRNDLPITYTVVWSLALANVIGAGLCVFLSGGIARLTTIRFSLLVPFLFMMIAFAAFQAKQTLWDLAALVAIGTLGVFMRRFGWSRPAFLIGFVLADQAEVYTYQVTQIARARMRQGGTEGLVDYLVSPISIALVVIIAVSVWLGARQGRAIHADEPGELEKDGPQQVPIHGGAKLAPMIFAGAVATFLAVALWDALSLRVLIDKVFPATIAGAGLVVALLLLVSMVRAPATNQLFTDMERDGEDAGSPYGPWSAFAWFGSLLILTALFGFVVALSIFFVAFLRLRAGVSWSRTAIMTVAGVGLIVLLAGALNRDFPAGLLQETVSLPWPLGDD